MSAAARAGDGLQVVRAHRLAVALVATASLLVVAALATSVRARGDDQPSGSFCLTFEHPAGQVDQARRLLTRGSLRDDEKGGAQRGAAPIVWSERTAAGAPDDLEEDAQVVAAGMRRALMGDDLAALDEPDFIGALARLERAAPDACAQVGH